MYDIHKICLRKLFSIYCIFTYYRPEAIIIEINVLSWFDLSCQHWYVWEQCSSLYFFLSKCDLNFQQMLSWDINIYEIFFSPTDIDECVTANPCDVNAVCTNTDGSYYCTCNAGYRLSTTNPNVCVGKRVHNISYIYISSSPFPLKVGTLGGEC